MKNLKSIETGAFHEKILGEGRENKFKKKALENLKEIMKERSLNPHLYKQFKQERKEFLDTLEHWNSEKIEELLCD